MIRAALLAMACVIGACGSLPPAADKPAPSGEIADSCSSGDDCALVDGCCGCNAGGQQLAIRKDAVAAFEASRPERCGGRMCPQFVSHDPTCDAEAICGTRNRCRVAPRMQHQ